MKTVEKKIDINAHIENLKCEISVENQISVAKLSFTNLGYGDLTAIKFDARGYNAFGDIVPINGKDQFFLIVQDLIVKRNETAVDLKAKLPSADIRKLELTESQICYADGSVVSYEGENRLAFDLEQFDNQEQLNALHKLYDENAMFKPKEFAQGYICSCGRFNALNETVCSLCGKGKSYAFEACSDNSLKKLVDEYHVSEQKDREVLKAEQKKMKEAKMKKRIVFGIAAVIVGLALSFAIHAIQLSHRTVYASESDMKAALQGTWTCYDEEYTAQYKLLIQDMDMTKRWVDLDSRYDVEVKIEQLKPDEGTFYVFSSMYTVLNNGNIKDDEGNEYEKGGIWSDSEEETSGYGTY